MKRIDSVLAALVVAVVVLGQSSEVQADHSPTNDPQLQSAHLCLKLVADFAQRPVLKNECKHKVIIYGLRGGFTNIGKGTINKGVTTGPGILDIEYTSGRVCVEYADGRTDNGGEAEQRDAGQKRCPSNRPLDDKDYDPFTMYPPEKLDAGLRGFPKTVEVPEGGSGTFKVRLTTSPRENLDDPDDDPAVTVTFASPGNDLTIDTDSVQSGAQNTVTFTGANWGMPRTVTVTSSASDDDVAVPAPVEVTVTATGGGSGDYSYAGVSGTLTIQVTETDEANLVLEDPTETLSVNEGESDTFKVKLSAQPGAAVTVNIASSNTDVTFSPTSLSFDASNWNTDQTVTVTAAQDEGAQDDEATLTLTASGGGFDDVNATKEVKVVDDDLVKFDIDPEPRNLTISEGGDATFRVRLNNKPEKNIATLLSQTPTANPDVTFTPTRLTFTTSDWSTYQTVTVSAAADEDSAEDTTTISLVGSEDGGYTGINPGGGPIIVNPGGPVTVVPPGTGGTLPTGPGVNPDPPCVGQNCTGNPLPTNPVATTFLDFVRVTVTDTGTAAQPVLSTTALEIDEGSSATFTVAMNKAPGSATTVRLSVPSGSAVSTNPTSLNFTANDWSAKPVTVSAAEDTNRINETVNIALSPRALGVDGRAVVVSVKDNDALDLVLSPASITINEGWETGVFTAKLAADPGAETEVIVRSNHIYVKVDTDSRLGGYQNKLTFTSSNWDTPQTVRVTGDNEIDLRRRDTDPPTDDDDEFIVDRDDENTTVSLTGTTVEAASLAVRVLDDEILRPMVSVSSALVVDEGSFKTFKVRLSNDPGSNITVNVASTNTADVTVDPSTLTFQSNGVIGDWINPQTVTVTAQQDADGTDDSATINLTAAALSQPAAVEVQVMDDESGPELIVSPDSTLTVAEGGSAPFTVRLNNQPSDEVTVTLAQSGTDNDDVTFNPSRLTFSTSDWNTGKTVTVSAADDSDTTDDTATIGLTAAGGGFDNITESVPVSVTDKGAPDLTLAGMKLVSSTLTVAEAGSEEFTVRLSVRPTADVRVSLARSGSADVTFDTDPDMNDDQSTLDFTTTDWQTPQTVTVSAAADGDGADDTATITLTASGGDYASVTKSVSVSVTDDDTPGLTLAGTKLVSSTLTVAEDDSEDFTVRLNTQPSAEVTVTLAQTGTDNDDVSFDTDPDMNGDQSTLTFSTSDWNTGKTVTVSAADDSDITNDSATITLTPSGGDYADVTAVNLSVTVTDDDSPGFAFTRTPLTVAEGETGTFMVALKTLPSANVTVTLARSGSTDVTFDTDTGQSGDQDTLTFETGNWDSPQTVTVVAAEDHDSTDDTATITLTASGGGYNNVNTDNTVQVTVTDDDSPGFDFGTSPTFDEGSTGSFTVKLKTQPSADVTVTLARSGSTDVTFDTDTGQTGDQDTLTFTATNWNMDQTVTVAAVDDDDADNDTATISFSASGGGYDDVSTDNTVTVTVNDTDTRGYTLNPTALTIDEEGNRNFTVKLDTRPSANVTVTLTPESGSDVGVDTDSVMDGNQATLTFTGGADSNWNTPQTVTVSADSDNDAADDTATITLSAEGGGYDSVGGSIVITVEDNDTPAVEATVATLTVIEGRTGKFDVSLQTQPSGTVTVAVAASGDSDVTVSPPSLTFDGDDWNMGQEVTVTAAEDTDSDNDTATITLNPSGADYADVDDLTVSITVTDNDTPGLDITPSSLTVEEGSNNQTFGVKLNTMPSAQVTVTLAQKAPTNDDVSVSPTRLIFSTTNWHTAKTVTVTADEDDDVSEDTATFELTSAGGDYADLDAVEMVITVNDTSVRGITLSDITGTSLTVSEGDSSGDTFKVELDTQPTGTVTVAVTRSGSSDVSVSPASLTFSTSNWDTGKTVTVTAVEDDDAFDDTATITLNPSGADYGNVDDVVVSVTVDDDDTPGLTFDPTNKSLAVTEEGAAAELKVKLNTEPSADVTVMLALSDSDLISADSTSLTFTALNWETQQTVNVTADEDDDARDGSATITITATGGGSGGNDHSNISETVSVSVTDNDEPGLTLAPTALTVAEGESKPFTVKLDTEPAADVTVTLAQPTNTDVTLDTDSATAGNQRELTFTAATWDNPQTVTVSAIDDDDGDEDTATIGLTANGGGSGDDSYAGVTDSIVITVTDTDVPNLIIDPSGTLDVNEGGSSTFTVKLSLRPDNDVTVTLTQPSNTEVTLDTDTGQSGNQRTLTFSTTNWDREQTVTVSAAEDDDAIDDSAVRIEMRASGGGYGSATKNIDVNVKDNDERGLTLTPPTLAIDEGETGTFTVKLNSRPSAEVTVELEQPSNTDVRIDRESLTFRTTNWNREQTVTVSAADDNDAVDDTAIVWLRPDGGDYGDSEDISIRISVEDDDVTGLTIVPPEKMLTINEGSGGSFTVRLASRPSATVTVRLGRSSNPDVIVSPSLLTFTASDWNIARTVAVGSEVDDDTVDDTARITLSSSGGEYTGTNETVSIRVIDAGEPPPPPPPPSNFAIVASPASLSLDEGESGSFDVRLGARPDSNVRVSLRLPPDSEINISAGSLIFMPSNWGTAQRVTVASEEDDDFLNESVRIALNATGGGYTGVDAGVMVSISDNDSFGGALVLSTDELILNEGASGTFTVRLSTRPDINVKVNLSRPFNPDVKVDTDERSPGNQNFLTFTSQDWNTPKTVTVFAAVDNDANEDSATLRLTASGGGYSGVMDELSVVVIDDDLPPALILFPATNVTLTEGDSGIFTVRLATRPSTEVTLALRQPTNFDIRVDTDANRDGYQNKLVFTRTNWNEKQPVIVIAATDADDIDNRTDISMFTEGAGEYSNVTAQITAIAIESDPALAWTSRSVVPAIPPVGAHDGASIRIRCREQGRHCDAFLDCTSQDGTIYRGHLRSIPSLGTRTLSIRELVDTVGGDWSGQGRLLCSLRSEQRVGGQIWTRSGDGVLVNNSQALRSVEEAGARGRTYHWVDIESIPSPDDSNLSNIRIRCEGRGEDCPDVVFECYTDDGILYSGSLGFIGRGHTRHLQTEELASMIGYRWHGMRLSCEVRSDAPISVQVLTRTGGGRALVNNSATGVYRRVGVR